jgi:DNA polymerase
MPGKKSQPGALSELAREFSRYLEFAGAHGLMAGARDPKEADKPLLKREDTGGDSLEKVAREVGTCRLCPLWESRTRAVPGEGSASARLMVIGEAPGRQEDKAGQPFVGEAGRMLTAMLEAIGHPRPSVFITNMIKCRPPGNRDPLPGEIETCRSYLERQLALIRPQAVLSLGRVSSQQLLQTSETISRLRGSIQPLGDIEVFPTFHPAYLLRNPEDKRLTWEDLQQLQKRLAELE